MITAQYSWFVRGGSYLNNSDAGVFYFNATHSLGATHIDGSFRLVMSPST